jgi:hypothetical protein
MKNRIAFIAWLVVFTLLLTACSTTVTSVYLLRHAERPGGQDPDLTPEGQQRAQELVRVLKNVPVAAVYSTDTNRTRQTAQPLATDHGLTLQFYSTISSRHRSFQPKGENLGGGGAQRYRSWANYGLWWNPTVHIHSVC